MSEPILFPPVARLKFTRLVKAWEFPRDRFVTYGPEDEGWCRYFGVGREAARLESVVIPRAVITGVNADGSVRFTAVSTPEVVAT